MKPCAEQTATKNDYVARPRHFAAQLQHLNSDDSNWVYLCDVFQSLDINQIWYNFNEWFSWIWLLDPVG